MNRRSILKFFGTAPLSVAASKMACASVVTHELSEHEKTFGDGWERIDICQKYGLIKASEWKEMMELKSLHVGIER